MFSIVTEKFFGREKIKLINDCSGEYLSVIPDFGGNLNELVLSKNSQLHPTIAGDETLETLSGVGQNSYRGAKLSPFPNRINSARYMFRGKEYRLEKNAPPHALHGLCWNIPLTIKDHMVTNNSAKLILGTHYEMLPNGFPFTYQIKIEYILEENGFKCSTTILNTDKGPIPIGDGWHPYFTTGSHINVLKLQIPGNKLIVLDNNHIPTGSYLPNQAFSVPALLNDTLLDHCFEIDTYEDIAETRLIDEDKNLSVIVWQKAGNRGYRFVQVYTASDRNSIAIEPMSCSPDAFNNEQGLIILSPKESIEFCFGVRLE